MRNDAPTKTNLLRLKGDLEFAHLGYELLDQKRSILVMELLNLVDEAVEVEARTHDALAAAYRDLEDAILKMGRLRVASVAQAVNIGAEISFSQRRVMGVSLPVVDTSYTEYPPYYGLSGTSYSVDRAVKDFKSALELLGRLAELKISIMRLAQEVKKTIRKVNALEKIAIPDLDETVGFIQNRLEENEREMFVLMKMVKARLERRKEKEERIS